MGSSLPLIWIPTVFYITDSASITLRRMPPDRTVSQRLGRFSRPPSNPGVIPSENVPDRYGNIILPYAVG